MQEALHYIHAFWLELLRDGYNTAASREIPADYRVVKSSRSNDKLKSAKNCEIIYRKVEKLSLIKSAYVFAAYVSNGLTKYIRR